MIRESDATILPADRDVAEGVARRAFDVFTVAALAVLWALFAIWAYNLERNHQGNIEQTLDRQRVAIGEHVDGVFKISEAFLVLASRWVKDNPERDPRSDPGFVELVKDFQRVTNASMLVRLVEADGTLRLIPETPGAKPANVADRDYFVEAAKAAPGKIYISKPFQGRATGRWAVSVATRFAQPSHGVTTIFVAIELSLFDSAFSKARMGESGTMSLLRRDGVILARSANTQIELGKNISASPVFASGLTKNNEGVIFTESKTTDSIPKLMAYGASNAYPLVVTVGLPIETINKETRETIIRVGLMLLLFSLLAGGARWKIADLLRNLMASRQQLLASNDLLAIEVEERRQIEKALRLRDKSQRALLDNFPFIVWLKDTEGRFLAVNQPLANACKHASPDDLVGKTDFGLWPDELARHYREDDEEVMRSGQPKIVEEPIKDGDKLSWFETYKSPIRVDGEIVGTVGFARDISEKKRYIAEIERSNAELEQFAYVASHDLREPLRMVSSYVDLLERRYGAQLDDAGRDFIGFAKDGALRMNALVQDLLDVSRVGRSDSPIVPTPLRAPFDAAITNLRMMIAECQAEISAPDAMPTVMVCQEEMVRLFQNLLGNALKYRSPKRPCRIAVTVQEKEDFWSFTICDNGIGIEKEYSDKIFRIFQRLHGREEYGGGSGIGLAICKKIVECHGGEIIVESDGVTGSCFSFTLPRLQTGA